MLRKKLCIVGTDTEIGKTHVSCAIIRQLANVGLKVGALKPIASGIEVINNETLNLDSYQLKQCINIEQTINEVNPILFNEPIAPHIAADLTNYELNVTKVVNLTNDSIKSLNYDYLIIEGVGGIHTPLNKTETYLDLLKAWNYPVILVVGMKLGCLNHALLTMEILLTHRINCIGWIANYPEPSMLYPEENLIYLSNKFYLPLLGINHFNHELGLDQDLLLELI